jgi:hypothetical protein
VAARVADASERSGDGLAQRRVDHVALVYLLVPYASRTVRAALR